MKNKKTIVAGSALILFIIVVVAGITLITGKEDSSGSDYGNDEYTKCVNEANRLADENEKIRDQVDTEIEQCTRDYIKAEGFDDDIDCIEDYTNPICESTERYNAEVNGGNQCNENREEKLKDAGYKTDLVPAVDCTKYLGK